MLIFLLHVKIALIRRGQELDLDHRGLGHRNASLAADPRPGPALKPEKPRSLQAKRPGAQPRSAPITKRSLQRAPLRIGATYGSRQACQAAILLHEASTR